MKQKKNSKKINLDKYYTSPDLAEHCIDRAYELIGKENITEVIEPSAGNGSFSNRLEGCIAYDIEPDGENIIKANYLELKTQHKKGRLIIGNPPYGTKNTLSVQFYKKSVQIADYIAFILPISQLDNNQQMYEFDLVHSEDLGKQFYTDRYVHCCFNVYRRNPNGLNKKPNYKMKDVEIVEYRRGNKKHRIDEDGFEYDIAICAWGASIGKEIEFKKQYAQEFYIVIKNKEYKEEIINIFNTVDWKKEYNMTASPSLYQWQVYKYIKDNIKNIN